MKKNIWKVILKTSVSEKKVWPGNLKKLFIKDLDFMSTNLWDNIRTTKKEKTYLLGSLRDLISPSFHLEVLTFADAAVTATEGAG